MLAQNFKTAEELGLTEFGYSGLLRVLGMLERGELVYTTPGHFIPNGFNMREAWSKGQCGTIGCIGGYAGRYNSSELFTINVKGGDNCGKLFCPPDWRKGRYTVEQAAKAVRSFLVTGTPDWGLD